MQVVSDVPFSAGTFATKFDAFAVAEATADTIRIRHHFGLVPAQGDCGQEIFRSTNWAISRRDGHFIYRCLMGMGHRTDRIAVFDDGYCYGRILNSARIEEGFRRGGLNSLTSSPLTRSPSPPP